MNKHFVRAVAGLALAAVAAYSGVAGAQEKRDKIRIGFVTFLSGPAAGPFGVPAKMAAEAIVEQLKPERRRHPTTPRASAEPRWNSW